MLAAAAPGAARRPVGSPARGSPARGSPADVDDGRQRHYDGRRFDVRCSAIRRQGELWGVQAT
jgi:hypothetical protein